MSKQKCIIHNENKYVSTSNENNEVCQNCGRWHITMAICTIFLWSKKKKENALFINKFLNNGHTLYLYFIKEIAKFHSNSLSLLPKIRTISRIIFSDI